jgi:hypothetical protein
MTTPNMNQGQLLNNIKSLQNLEQKLYLDLEKLPNEVSNTDAQKEIVDKINQLSQSRIGLYSQVHQVHSLLKNNVTTESKQLDDHLKLANIVEKQLNNSKNHINNNKVLNNNNLRLIEINTYYTQQYNAYYVILKRVAYLCLPLLILMVVKQTKFVSLTIINILGIIILTIGLFFIIPKIIDLYARDNMVFSEYDQSAESDTENKHNIIEYDKKELDLLNNQYLKDLVLLEKGECLGPECCSSGQQFVANRCVDAKQKL